eukprot:753595-Hanusia_phi.AAC.3
MPLPLQSDLQRMRMMAPAREIVVGLQCGIQDKLKCIGLLTKKTLTSLSYPARSVVKRCTLCGEFYLAEDKDVKLHMRDKADQILTSDYVNLSHMLAKWSLECRYHVGFWTPQRRIRPEHTLRRCGAPCGAIGCQQRCNRFMHRSKMAHACGDNRCCEPCSVSSCKRRCCILDHFHGLKDSSVIHTCGKPHACQFLCVCGEPCEHVTERGEPTHELHYCGSKEGCTKPCFVAGCEDKCASSNHHHDLEEGAVHCCYQQHPCLAKCRSPGCDLPCVADRQFEHEHRCEQASSRSCMSVCSVKVSVRWAREELTRARLAGLQADLLEQEPLPQRGGRLRTSVRAASSLPGAVQRSWMQTHVLAVERGGP